MGRVTVILNKGNMHESPRYLQNNEAIKSTLIWGKYCIELKPVVFLCLKTNMQENFGSTPQVGDQPLRKMWSQWSFVELDEFKDVTDQEQVQSHQQEIRQEGEEGLRLKGQEYKNKRCVQTTGKRQ